MKQVISSRVPSRKKMRGEEKRREEKRREEKRRRGISRHRGMQAECEAAENAVAIATAGNFMALFAT
jgi:hypothetical protein